jgi:hypothetical protein
MHDRVGQRSAGRLGSGDDRLRPLLAALLVLAVLLGVRSGPSLTWSNGWIGPWHDRGHGIAVLAALELVFAALIVALRIRARRSSALSQPAATLRAVLVRVIAFAMTVPPLALIGLYHLPKLRPRPRLRVAAPPPRTPVNRLHPAASALSQGAEIVRYLILGLLAVAALIAVVLLLRRLRFSAPAAGLAPEADDDTAALRHAVQAGRLALGELAEPRMAIINCYLAMERSLAAAGAARAGPETPHELLARSRAASLLHTTAADDLTGLFYAARFSTHPVSPEARDQAQRALDEIAAELAAATGQPAATP